MKKLIGPFTQIVTLRRLPLKGSLRDEKLDIIYNGGILIKDDCIKGVGDMNALFQLHRDVTVESIDQPAVLLPGFIDCHTHMCFAGNRSADYALRIGGKSYTDIQQAGGGIWTTVEATRAISEPELLKLLLERVKLHNALGVTTIEIKSGYGLNIDCELKMQRVIKMAGVLAETDIISTCLAAHIKPKDFKGNDKAYLQYLITHLLPVLKEKELCNRVDIFIEDSAFCAEDATKFLMAANLHGFRSTVHADQFSRGGSAVAINAGADSADHLEASTDDDIEALAKSDTVAVVLPGASMGLGMPYAPARKLLNEGACVAIASDWNPGSAPQGNLLMQAAVMGASEKLNTAETFAGLTYRAAHALRLNDRGIIDKGLKAHMQAYPCSDYREILYYQGSMQPFKVWK